MPKTRLQKLVFSLLMAFIMVFGMETYNHIIASNSFTIKVFYISLLELAGLMLIVIALEEFIAGKIARKIAFTIVNPIQNKPVFIILAIQVSTVLLMCPMMSFVATLIFKDGLHGNTLNIWLQTIIINFPMALLWQIFFAGPCVRFVVGKIKQ